MKRKSDENHGRPSKDSLRVDDQPIARSRAKRIKKTIKGLVQATWAKRSSAISNIQSSNERRTIHVLNSS